MKYGRVPIIWVALVSGLTSSTPSLPDQDQPVVEREIELRITEATAVRPVVSPDRQWIAIDLLGWLWIFPISGGEARKITPDTIEARFPSWSGDSQSLAFQGFDEAWHVYTVRTDGSNLKAVTDGPFDDRKPDWSRDGGRIAFSSDRYGGVTSIFQVEIPSGVVTQVSRFEGDDPCWAVDNRSVLFRGRGLPAPVSTQWTWWLAAPGQPERPLVPSPSTIGRRTAAVEIGCANGALHDLRSDPAPVPLENGQLITAAERVFMENGRVTRSIVSGTSPQTIPFTATVRLHRPQFAKTHRQLLPDQPQPVRGIVGPAVSPDGASIAFVALGDLWLLPIGQQPHQITNDVFVERDPAWSPDGRKLAFVSDRGGKMDLWVRDMESGSDRQLTEGTGLVSGPAWSPDGQRIAFLVNGRAPDVISVVTGGKTESVVNTVGLTNVLPTRGRPTWAPGGMTYGIGELFRYSNRFREGTNQLRLQSVRGDGDRSDTLVLHHSVGNRRTGGPVWSPDGFRLTFTSESRLWAIPVDSGGQRTGDPIMIATDLPSSPSWEGDSRHVVYQTPDGFRRVLADGSPPESIECPLGYLPVPPPERLVIHAGALFNGITPDLLRDVDIIVERGRFRDIVPHQDDLHTGTVIDASRETVIPGLFDMHARLDPSLGGALGRLLLAYGITSVRDPNADAYDTLEMRESFDAGKRIGPRVFTSGDQFRGMRVVDDGGVSIASETQLLEELERATRLDYDFFSVDSRLPDKYLERIAAYAHAHGRTISTPELSPAVTLGVDHIEGLRETGRRGFSSKVSSDDHSSQDVIDVLAKSGVSLTPLISASSGWLTYAARDRSVLDDPRMNVFPDQRQIEGLRAAAEQLRREPVGAQRLEAAGKALAANVRNIAAGGGTILAGSGSPGTPYGAGLHIELETWVQAGLTPLQALRAATTNAAEALGVADELGTIESGKLADLVIVEGDPLRDVTAIRRVQGVVRGGWYYSVAALMK